MLRRSVTSRALSWGSKVDAGATHQPAKSMIVPEGKMPKGERWWLAENCTERQAFFERNKAWITSKRTNWNEVFAQWVGLSWIGTMIYMARGVPDFHGRHTMMDGFYSHRFLTMAEKIPEEFKIKN